MSWRSSSTGPNKALKATFASSRSRSLCRLSRKREETNLMEIENEMKTEKAAQPSLLKRHLIFFLVLFALVGVLCASCQQDEAAKASKEGAAVDNQYLKSAGAEWDKLFNAGDISSLAALYAEDAMSMPFNAPTVRGRQAIQTELRNFLAQNTAKHETFIEDVLVSGDWAIERARYTMTYTPKSTAPQIIETGRHVMGRKKIDGRWQIAWEIWNSDQPLPK